MAERVSRSGADKRRAALRRAEPGRTKSWCRGYLSKAPWCVRGLKADATLARREANMPCWTATLLLAAALAVAGAAVAPKANDDVCHGQKQSCLDSRTLVICADLGAGLIPLNNLPCPAAYPFCKDGVCGLEPSTTTTTTTTITPPPDPCAGGERSCPDEHTLRVCVDLGAGLIFNSDTPCSPQAPFCVQGACVAAPTTTRLPPTNRPQPTTTPRPTPGPTTLPPASCGGQTVSCLDDATVLECADLGFGLVPVKEVRCGGSTPVCRAGTCGALPPTTPTAGTTTTARPAPPADICGGKLSVCGDCYTRTTCARIGREIVPVSNTTCPADQPYCVAGACEADLPADSSCPALPAPFSSFKCFADGYFPDPSDCRRFHLCVGDKAYDYDCTQAAAGLIYDQARALCVPLGQAQCFAFDCRGRASAYLTYRPDPTIYALCVTEDAADALLARCPAGRSLAVDPQNGLSVSCQPFCARAGRTADPDDASSFYECFATSAKSSARLVGPLKGSCPQGSEFDAASERCRSVAPAKPDSTTVITAATTIAPSAKKPWWW